MNDATKLRIRRELAERMGWTVKEFKHSFELCWPDGTFLQNPFGDSYPASFTSESDAWQYAPDPFTDHADCAALMTWLATDTNLKLRFTKQLMKQLKDAEGYTLFESHELGNDDYCDWFQFLTAPLETRVLAACAALGIGTEDE